MSYMNTHARTSKPSRADQQLPMGRLNKYFGVYLGFIKDAKDVQKNGRLRIWIPELASSPDDPQGWVIANYCSPFAGATNIDTASETNFQDFNKTQTSYGFWMIPPDINNEVLVMFINGDVGRPIWIGCLYNQFMNNMVPGMAGSENNYQYKDKFVPVAEYNKWDKSITSPDQTTKPYEKTKFKGISNQGLINDRQRGVTTSSARRESPSNVFGILTPGPVIEDVSAENIRRKGGSSFIMDDGKGTEYIQLATKSGAQIKIDETYGFIYIINRDGSAWIEMDKDGNVDVFSARSISLRAQRDFNIRADRNVNIEAGQNVFIKAAKDTIDNEIQFEYNAANTPEITNIPYFKYVGENNGVGGIVAIQAVGEIHGTSQQNTYFTSKEGSINLAAKVSCLTSAETGGLDFTSKMGVRMTTEGALDLSASNNIRLASAGEVSLIGGGNVAVCTSANLSLNAAGEIIISSGNTLSANADSVQIDAPVTVSSLNSQSIKASITETNSIKSATIAQNNQPIGGGYGGGAPIPVTDGPIATESPQSASTAQTAEVKALVDKINVIATWKQTLNYQEWQANTPYKAGDIVTYNQQIYIADRAVPSSPTFQNAFWSTFIPEDKFVRNAESFQTTVTRLPTYEPCPEHPEFRLNAIGGYTPPLTEADKTYIGSGGSGNDPSTSPIADTTPGANNTSIPPEVPRDNIVTKDVNLNALKCQLSIHEGYKNVVYLCSANKPTAGIGHLLRAPNEIQQYPLGTFVSDQQIQMWYEQDVVSSIKGAQRVIGVDTWANLSDIRKRATIDLVYNLGEAGFAKFKNTVSSIKEQNWTAVGDNLRDTIWYTQVGRRALNIITMFVRDVDPLGCDKKFPMTATANSQTGGTVVIGDAIAVGIGQNIPSATVNASNGFSSSKTLASVNVNTKVHNAKLAIISVGTNDIVNGKGDQDKLRENLMAIRTSLKAATYVWVLPYDKTASDIVASVAGNDKKVDLTQFVTINGIYPENYKAVTAAVLS